MVRVGGRDAISPLGTCSLYSRCNGERVGGAEMQSRLGDLLVAEIGISYEGRPDIGGAGAPGVWC